jgi:hypothetical protein
MNKDVIGSWIKLRNEDFRNLDTSTHTVRGINHKKDYTDAACSMHRGIHISDNISGGKPEEKLRESGACVRTILFTYRLVQESVNWLLECNTLHLSLFLP